MKYKSLVFTHNDLLVGVFEELAETRLPGKNKHCSVHLSF